MSVYILWDGTGWLKTSIISMISSIIILATYGTLTDEYVFWAEKVLEGTSKALVPGAFWVEFFPFLKHAPRWIPGTNHHSLIDYYRPFVLDLLEKPYADVERAVVSRVFGCAGA